MKGCQGRVGGRINMNFEDFEYDELKYIIKKYGKIKGLASYIAVHAIMILDYTMNGNWETVRDFVEETLKDYIDE